MVDTYVSFSNQNSMDLFPTFTSTSTTNNEQDPFKVDKRDVEEIQNRISTKPVEKPRKNKGNNPGSTGTTITVQCDICLVSICGPIVFDSHIKGKKHQGLLAAALAKNPDYKAPTYEDLCSRKQQSDVTNADGEKIQSSMTDSTTQEKPTVPTPLIPSKKFNCNMCNVSCNSQQMFDNHISGKKHLMKLKTNHLSSTAPTRVAMDTNPSSSNYCDICSVQLSSESELSQHLNQKQHQKRVKEAECCAKEGADMNINFDDYKITTGEKGKDNFEYQCTPCNKKFRNKIQLIEHLKSALHNRLLNPILSTEKLVTQEPYQKSQKVKRDEKPRYSRGNRGQNFPPNYGSLKNPMKPRSYPSQSFARNRPTQNFEQNMPFATSDNIFGAFAVENQVPYSPETSDSYYKPRKRPHQQETDSTKYGDYQSKYPRTYNDVNDTPQDSYTADGSYYSSSSINSSYPWNSTSDYAPPTNSYSSSSAVSQSSWQYQNEPPYDHQSYSNPSSTYTNSINYSSTQPPLPPYEPPPIPSYPAPPTYAHAPQSSTYQTGSGHNHYYSSSYGQ